MDLSTHIEAVTVYRRGAQVRRVAALPNGAKLPASVLVRDLPLSLEDDSVRVRIEADAPAGASPFAREVRITLDARGSDAAPEPPDDRALRAARQTEARLAALLAQAQKQAARASRLALGPRGAPKEGEPPLPSPTKLRLSLLELRRTRTDRMLGEMRRLEAELRGARAKRADLEERARRASSASGPKEDELRKAVLVSLGGASVAGARLVVEYVVPGARWAPAYSLRIDEKKKRAQLAVRAVVAQRTGEDWNAVEMSLSTADAQRFTELPELQSLRIGRAQPPPAARGWRALPPGAEELYADFDRAFDDDETVSDARDLDDEEDVVTAVTAAIGSAASTGAIDAPAAEMPAGRFKMRRLAKSPAPASARAEPAPKDAVSTLTRAPAPMGAPPPGQGAPAMAAQSMMMPAGPVRRRGGFPFSGLLGGSGGGMAPGGMAPGGMVAELAEELANLDVAAAQDLRVRAETRMLAYGNLRMPAADQPNRGQLTLIGVEESYRELMVSQRIAVRRDLLLVVDRELAAAQAAAERPPPPRHSFPSSQAGFDYAYRSDAPVDVPSDGHFHAIPLTAAEGAVELRHVVVPREAQDAFRYAEVPNPLDAPLLDGPADIYLGDEYLLTTDVRVTPPRGKLRLGLGVDPAIKVSRNTTFAEQTAGLIGGSLVLRHGIEIEVQNHRTDTADVEVRERVPSVPKDEEDIKIEVGDVEPPWKPYEQEEPRLRGGHAWRVQVEPGKRQKLRASYSIKIAAKNELVGGNRRER